jgi:hypothetical protein
MKKMIIVLASITALLFSLTCHAAPAVGSREYKLMLNANLFNGSTPYIQNQWGQTKSMGSDSIDLK